MSGTFTSIRSQALTLEKQTEGLLGRYSRYQDDNQATSDEEEVTLRHQITDILNRREEVLQKLQRVTDPEINSLSTSKLQQMQRHKEVLADHQRSFRKIETTIADERNRNNLLFSVTSDIEAHKPRTPNVGKSCDAAANDYILEEGVRVDNANSFADRLLQQAYQTRDELYSQRAYLTNAQLRMMSTVQLIPGINVLVLRINTRRRRDTLILATVIAVCILMLVFL